MINYETIEDTIYDVVQPILNCTTIFDRPNAPRPAERPYATINVNNIRQLGREESDAPDGTGTCNVWAHYSLDVEFTAFGTGAKNTINRLQFAFNKSSVVDALLAGELALVGHDNVLDLPQIRDTIWEENSRFNATFHVRIADTDEVGFIEHFTGTGSLLSGVDGNPITVPVQVDIAP